MRFELVLKRDKLKGMENIFKMTASLLRTKNQSFEVLLLYLPNQEHVRVLVKRDEAPILIVLFKELFYRIASHSKSNQEENSTIGFEFKNGLMFIEEILTFLKEDQSANIVLEEENSLFMKIAKQKEFRYLEIRNKSRVRKVEINKPSKNEEELYSYHWIDGVKNCEASFRMNMAYILQMLKFASKCRTSFPIQSLQEKSLALELNLEGDGKGKGSLSLQGKPSKIGACGFIHLVEGQKKEYSYEIRIDDCELLTQTVKPESTFIIDKEKDITIIFSQENLYQCQISMRNLIKYVGSEEALYLKQEM